MSDEILKIVIPGEPITKKNGHIITCYNTYEKNGKKVKQLMYGPNGFVIPKTFPKKEYREWSKIAAEKCAVIKTKNRDISFPISHQINLKMLVFLPDFRVADLTGYEDAIQDVLKGSAYINLPSVTYQIILDDNYKIVSSKDGSRVYVDKENPRVEIYINKFNY